MRNKEIKSAINEWKKKLIDDLKSHKKKKIEVYFIPKYWENDSHAYYNLSYFDNNIKNTNDVISSKSEFFIIEKEHSKNLIDYSKKDLIKTEAKYENDKLIIDLGNDNFYFYYLNSKYNLCEGYIVSKGENKEKSIIEGFKFNPPHDFIFYCLRDIKPEFKNNLVIYHINNFIFTYKDDEELINDLKKQEINYKGNNKDNNKVNNEKDIKIIKCIISYFFSEYKYKSFLEEEKIKYKNSKRISKNELKFILINKEWINLFKEKYNYEYYQKIIDEKRINEDNCLDHLKYFKDINSEIIDPIKSTQIVKFNLMNSSYTIFHNYELITPETYDILVKCFGKEKNEENIELNVINMDLSYIIVKYNSKMIEIIRIRDESERFLIIGQNNLDDNILKELLNKGFKEWLKFNKITEYKNYSIEIVEKEKIIGMLYYLPKLKFNENKVTIIEDNRTKTKDINDERNQKRTENEKGKEEARGEIADNNIKEDRFYSRINKMQEANEKEKENKQKIETNNNIIRTRRKSKTIKNLECCLSLPPEGLVGLQNVGATCYMNASLQCFSNIQGLRGYFLKHKPKIKNNKNKLSSSLLTIFENIWEKPSVTYYAPQEFKDIISEMNPLFKGIQANDAKDLILFILETIHNELNEKNNSINGNNISNPLDYNSVFVNFSIFFRKNYNSIISNLFYGMNNSMMTCCTCRKTVHNVQCFNILIFPLEEVRKYKGYYQNIVSIYDCFDYNEKQDFMVGENQISCNFCNRMSNSMNQTKIIISPNVLIINLNRGRGLMYDIKLNFCEYIDIKKYIFYSASPHYYELVGVISHIGGSDMSGHFIAFCRNSQNCKWYKFNDAIVTESNFQEALNFGVPYVLFYNYVKC